MRTTISIFAAAVYSVALFALLALSYPRTTHTTVTLGQPRVIAVQAFPSVASNSCSPERTVS